MPVRELTTGSTFAGRYQVIEELGRGGMGKVYKVFDTRIKEKVALKLIKAEIASDRETIERFGFPKEEWLDPAIEEAHKAVALAPAFGFTCADLGYIYYGLDDPVRAGEWLKKGLELQPDLDWANMAQIEFYLGFRENNKAVEQSQKLLSKFPDHPWALEDAAYFCS